MAPAAFVCNLRELSASGCEAVVRNSGRLPSAVAPPPAAGLGSLAVDLGSNVSFRHEADIPGDTVVLRYHWRRDQIDALPLEPSGLAERQNLRSDLGQSKRPCAHDRAHWRYIIKWHPHFYQ